MDKTGIISEKLACSTWQEREEMLFDLACRLDNIKKRENFAFCDMRDAKTEKEKNAAAIEWREAWDMFAENADKNGATWGEIAAFQEYLRLVGKSYGLIKELRENGLL